MLQLTQVKKSFAGKPVLDIPLLQLDNGVYWLRGANGSGKTTLLRMAAALLPFEGDISFRGTSLRKQPLAYRRLVSWAEAEPLYPDFMTGTELLTLYREIRKAETKAVEQLLELFDMHSYVDQAVGTYSAGMTKKLSLALAFLGDPPLILLDEPLITLDAASLAAAGAYIDGRSGSGTSLFLLTSHQEADMHVLPSGRELFVNNQTISYEALLPA